MPAPSPYGQAHADNSPEGVNSGAGILLEQLKSPSEHDIAVITTLWIATGLIPAIRDARQDIENCIKADHGSLIVARHPSDNQIIATMMTGHDDIFGWIHYLAVAKLAQNRGIGHELVGLAEDIVRSSGLSQIRVTVETPAAGDFYAKLGYELINHATDQATPDTIRNTIMRKSLDQ
ncbi:MAG: GNAT family N-acetyltransferase [Rhodospirillales bacterium]|nr:GNAT family N-acetyltransferase [Rhodospirillales bacterium]